MCVCVNGLTPSAFLSHRWDIGTTNSDLPILFSYDDGVTMSETGIILFLDTTERVNIVDNKDALFNG